MKGHATATLDLASLLSLINTVEASTGLRSTYTLTLIAECPRQRHPRRFGAADDVRAAMAFSLNQLELQPIARRRGPLRSGAARSSTRTSSGAASGRRLQAMQLSFVVVRVPVAAARARPR